MAYIWIILAVVVIAIGAVAISRRRQVFDESSEPTYQEEERAVQSAESGSAPAGAGVTPEADAGLGRRVRSLFVDGPNDHAWSRLEDLLVRADVGPKAASQLVERVRERVGKGTDPEAALTTEIAGLLSSTDPGLQFRAHGELTVIMVVGVNGSGKTTTIGKLAGMLSKQGKSVAIAAADTFRAAAGEQLDVWAKRGGARLVSGDRGADPGSIAFDAATSAKAKGEDVLIVDTAGRLHTRTPLMHELAKVRRVLEKAAGAVDETLLVLDATTGQNGIAQATAFTEAAGVTGVVLTKMDGTAKGGIVLAVTGELGIPVKLIGTGEGQTDLAVFDAKAFAERLVQG